MSAIGDYVHMTWQGYSKHGIYREGHRGTNSYSYNSIENRVKSFPSISKKTKDMLYKTLGAFFDSNPSDAMIKQYQQEVIQELLKRVNTQIREINFDFDTGKVTTNDFEKKKSRKYEFSDSKIKAKSVNQLLNDIIALQKDIENNYNNNEIGIRQQDIERLEQLQTKVENLRQYLKESSDIKNLRSAGAKKIVDLQKKNINLLKEVKTLYEMYLKTFPINLLTGEFEELALVKVPKVAERIGVQEADKIITEHFGPVKEGGLDQKKDMFGPFSKEIEALDKKFFIEGKTSQSKVDVKLTWKEESYNISAKNYNLKAHSDIKIVDGTRLLTLLKDEPIDYINHFLNVFAKHYGNWNKIGYLKSLRYNDIKKIILYKALTGDFGGRAKANIFIVNDNSTGKVRIINIKDIINHIENAPNIGNIFGFDEQTELGTFNINQVLRMTPQQRIANIIVDARRIKIEASLETRYIKSFAAGE